MGLSSWWPCCCPANHSSLKGMFAAEWSGGSWRPSKVPSKQMGPFGHMRRPHLSVFTLTLKAGKKGWISQLHASQTWLGITSPGDLRGTYSGWPPTRPDGSEHFGMGPEELYFKGIIIGLLGGSRKLSHGFLELSQHFWGVRVSKSILLRRLLKLKEIKKIQSRPYN